MGAVHTFYVLSQVALFTAVRSGGVKEVKKALASGARMHARGETVSPVSVTPMRSNEVAVAVRAAILLYMRCFRAHTVSTVGNCQDAGSSGMRCKASNRRQHNSCSIAVQGRTALFGLATLMWPL